MICIEYMCGDKYIDSWYDLFIGSSDDRFYNYFIDINNKHTIVSKYLNEYLNGNFMLINVTYNDENIGIINYNDQTKYFGYLFTDKYKGLYLGRKAVTLFLNNIMNKDDIFYANVLKTNTSSINLLYNLGDKFLIKKINENDNVYIYSISLI